MPIKILSIIKTKYIAKKIAITAVTYTNNKMRVLAKERVLNLFIRFLIEAHVKKGRIIIKPMYIIELKAVSDVRIIHVFVKIICMRSMAKCIYSTNMIRAGEKTNIKKVSRSVPTAAIATTIVSLFPFLSFF